DRAHRTRQADPPRRSDRERFGREHASAVASAVEGRHTLKVTKTYVRLMAVDVAKTAGFYRRALGLVPRSESPSWTELSADGGIVALHDGGAKAATETHLGFEVDDINAACAAVQREGGEVVAKPVDQYGILVARAADPDGNRFWLAQVPS
ncbi:MAG: hypothetical protein E6I66_13435, partial [Chloroflexi bacterium]